MVMFMNLVDILNILILFFDLMLNRIFLNLVKKKRIKLYFGYGKVGIIIICRFFFKYFNNVINKFDRRNVSINFGLFGGCVK